MIVLPICLSKRHSGFNGDNSVLIAADNLDGQITLVQYIISNTFSVEKLPYNEQNRSFTP
ncbi:MAG: hypothetical protein ACMUJM_25970 [bacterium]